MQLQNSTDLKDCWTKMWYEKCFGIIVVKMQPNCSDISPIIGILYVDTGDHQLQIGTAWLLDND